ncbi:hypothetical protein RRG08_014634 [Elysia crispata]|uniref:Uncharacterized protein n=1 Tax=Elysia crispata TaxID=231223 RepID=A0AAE1D3E7_9GAST|nr:hypothetical protein RRG08_014634 [Elysia crispata]
MGRYKPWFLRLGLVWFIVKSAHALLDKPDFLQSCLPQSVDTLVLQTSMRPCIHPLPSNQESIKIPLQAVTIEKKKSQSIGYLSGSPFMKSSVKVKLKSQLADSSPLLGSFVEVNTEAQRENPILSGRADASPNQDMVGHGRSQSQTCPRDLSQPPPAKQTNVQTVSVSLLSDTLPMFSDGNPSLWGQILGSMVSS